MVGRMPAMSSVTTRTFSSGGPPARRPGREIRAPLRQVARPRPRHSGAVPAPRAPSRAPLTIPRARARATRRTTPAPSMGVADARAPDRRG
jgi:hypothetical protein